MSQEVRSIAFCCVVADMLHFGHLQVVKKAKEKADLVICGVLTDKVVASYRRTPLMTYEERSAIVQELACVHEVIKQDTLDPTAILKDIHKRYPQAKIILVHGDNWQEVPGARFIKSIGGELYQPPYYKRLSEFKIREYYSTQEQKDVKDFTTYIGSQEKTKNVSIISTKANTLKALQPLLKKSTIEPLFAFNYMEWKNNKHALLQQIKDQFSPHLIVARSSAVNEDTLDKSFAGYFESVLNISTDSLQAIEAGIQQVIDSYTHKGAQSSFNQVLVQKQTQNIAMSGVVFTRSLEKNAPYYIINYDDTTGSTDSVTAGREQQMMCIFRFTEHVPQKMQPVIAAVKEIEALIPTIPLDIEFAVTQNNKVVIFQVRPLAANINKKVYDEQVAQKIKELKAQYAAFAQPVDHLPGDTTYFADMPDWNPAEIIGEHPNHLAYSLYDYIITNQVWHKARTSQGYFDVKDAKLVELFGNKPYINVRHTFSSFTPASLSETLRHKLVNFYLEKLKNNPHLQDKVEFDILYTCYDCTFDKRSQELLQAGFSQEEVIQLKEALLEQTNMLLKSAVEDIQVDLEEVFSLEKERTYLSESKESPLHKAKQLLDVCKEKGTLQFSRLARLGFIAKIILKSLVQQKAVTQDFYDRLLNSISTVATTISTDFNKVAKGEMSKEAFLRIYYHLRPGTYDITSLRYEHNPQLLKTMPVLEHTALEEFVLDEISAQAITKTLYEHGLVLDAPAFVAFVKAALEARELSKFEFTKNLSDALEYIAQAAQDVGFTRQEVAQLSVQDLFILLDKEKEEVTPLWQKLIAQRESERIIHDQLLLTSTLFSPNDFEVVQHHIAKPNFITQKQAKTAVVHLENQEDMPDIQGKIVVLENGDPGYDWIFTREPAGLITKYGGVASHMAIRCAEFGIPAAIGCGSVIFDRVRLAQGVHLDCKEKKIVPISSLDHQ